MIYGLILAGGKGSRLYPLSRIHEPKQFLKILDNKSFLVNTIERILPLVEKENIYIVTNKDYEDKIKEEIHEKMKGNIFIEPENKETATCIGLSAIKLLKKDPNAVMVVLPSDHYIDGSKEYLDTLKQAVDIANKRRCIITLGIEARRAETGYGYIQMGERIGGNIPTYRVERFTEKPNIEVAKDFIQKGTYLWNSGIFIFKADVILREIERYLPKMHSSLMEIYKHMGEEEEERIIKEQYENIEGISIDFGIMQKTRKAYVIKCNFTWDDIGSFTALSRFLNKDNSNRVSGNVYLEECENCSVFSKKGLIVGFGVKDLVMVEAGDVILIVDKNREQEIKHLIDEMGKKNEYIKFL